MMCLLQSCEFPRGKIARHWHERDGSFRLCMTGLLQESSRSDSLVQSQVCFETPMVARARSRTQAWRMVNSSVMFVFWFTYRSSATRSNGQQGGEDHYLSFVRSYLMFSGPEGETTKAKKTSKRDCCRYVVQRCARVRGT